MFQIGTYSCCEGSSRTSEPASRTSPSLGISAQARIKDSEVRAEVGAEVVSEHFREGTCGVNSYCADACGWFRRGPPP